MKVIEPGIEIMSDFNGSEIIKHIERCGRTCYKSENLITDSSAETFVRGIIKRGHESVLEHASITVKFIIDRGVLAEITRHRLASYSAESSRYCNYYNAKFGNSITVIHPCFFKEGTPEYTTWYDACLYAETAYLNLIKNGAKPEQARDVLPMSLKTELVMTMNMRELRHFLKLRCDNASHPQMREVSNMLLKYMHNKCPVIVEDLWEKYGTI